MVDLAAPYIQRGLIEVLLLAVIAGVLGTWIVLRRLPFYTHAIGTATFPGLVVAGPWGVPAQLTALVCAIGFGGVLERLQRSKRIDPLEATTEARPRPPQADDPRPSDWRKVPPF